MQTVIEELILKQAISEVETRNLSIPGFYNRLFLVDKKRRRVMTSSRPKQIEQFCCKRKVQNGRSFRSKSLLKKGYHMTKLDFTEAYWSIPVSVRSQPYLRFRWKNRVFQFLVLPFGLPSALRIFYQNDETNYCSSL